MKRIWMWLGDRRRDLWDAAKAMTGARAARIGYYAALIALLAVLGSASYAYRPGGEAERAERPAPTPAVRAAAALPTPMPTPEPMKWVWPLEGDIVGAFAPETTVWSATLSQWQTHDGVDIAGSPGEAVYACADGVVTDAWKDALWGNVVRVEHADGSVATYAGLNTLNMVSAGDAVKAGDIVGAVGNSAVCESDMPWHLHFALERDGVPVDFAQMMADSGV